MRRSTASSTDKQAPAVEEFARDVRVGLSSSPKRLPPRWLYDALGSALFEAIGHLPWYPITRAESGLLSRHARELVPVAAGRLEIIELGVGDGRKLAQVVAAFAAAGRVPDVHLVDVSPRALEAGRRALSRFAPIQVTPHEATFEDGLRRATAASGAVRLVLFLGSNIGNFDRAEADRLIDQVGASLGPGDLFLLGTDLVKPERALISAYDDPLGLTAAFNKNLLQRINAELGGSFDLRTFEHEARWNRACSRVEMHLVSTRPQQVRIPHADLVASFGAGDSIWTESSYKYERHDIAGLGLSGGFVQRMQWVDPVAGFALTLFARR